MQVLTVMATLRDTFHLGGGLRVSVFVAVVLFCVIIAVVHDK